MAGGRGWRCRRADRADGRAAVGGGGGGGLVMVMMAAYSIVLLPALGLGDGMGPMPPNYCATSLALCRRYGTVCLASKQASMAGIQCQKHVMSKQHQTSDGMRKNNTPKSEGRRWRDLHPDEIALHIRGQIREKSSARFLTAFEGIEKRLEE